MPDHVNTTPASEELQARAVAGPHQHWSSFDLKLEGSRFQRLHEIVSAPAFDADAANEVLAQIIAFARGHGYGQADSFLADTHNMSDEDIDGDPQASIWKEQLFSSYDETEYFEYVSKSQRLLAAAAVTEEAKAFVRNLTVDALDAFCDGRDACVEDSKSTAGAKP